MSVFVTVGTTSFNELIAYVFSKDIITMLEDLGYSKITAQYGRGTDAYHCDAETGLTIESFAFKPSLQPYMNESDLIISHAGAGSCLEALTAGKKLIVVVNENLMDNHQLELAQKLYEDKHVLYCTVKDLGKTLQRLKDEEFLPFPAAQTDRFRDNLDDYFGLTLKS